MESFTASQSYAFGAIAGQMAPEVHLIDGRFIEKCSDLDKRAIGKPEKERSEPSPMEDMSADAWRVASAARMLEQSAERLGETVFARNDALCREAYLAGGLLANSLVTRGQVLEAFLPAMTENGYLDIALFQTLLEGKNLKPQLPPLWHWREAVAEAEKLVAGVSGARDENEARMLVADEIQARIGDPMLYKAALSQLILIDSGGLGLSCLKARRQAQRHNG